MSDERTHAPSNRRRQLAREQGMVARSGELTAAVALLALVVVLGLLGEHLAPALVELVRQPLGDGGMTGMGSEMVVDRIRRIALALALPIGGTFVGVFLAAVLAHQLQVGGLWVPGVLAPNPSRLWACSRPSGWEPSKRFGRSGWAILRFGTFAVLAFWMIRAELPRLAQLADLETLELARTLFAIVHGLVFRLALVLLGLGLLDLFWQHRQLESLLRATPEQHREDQRAQDGDPALRSRRRRAALEWWQHPVGVEAVEESRTI